LYEALNEDYLRYRVRSIAYAAERLAGAGVPVVQPPGGHAIYIDAREMLPHIPDDQYPAWSLTNALYLAGGIRTVEIGSVMFGRQPDGSERPAPLDLVRLAFPRRVYMQSHVDYLDEVIVSVYRQREKIKGHRILWEAPFLRHFTVQMTPVDD
jgi:tryptophanase